MTTTQVDVNLPRGIDTDPTATTDTISIDETNQQPKTPTEPLRDDEPAATEERSENSGEPPFIGWVEHTGDALSLFEAVRRGLIARVTRRLVDSERSMIKSGSVFIFDEEEAGIKRWTDGILWSPSRMSGNFMVYRETDKPQRLVKAQAKLMNAKTGSSPTELQAPFNPLSRPKSGKIDKTGTTKTRERNLVGSLTDHSKFKQGGLIKKTFAITIRGSTQHLISYYTIEDVQNGRLRTPSSLPELASLEISPEYLEPSHFRCPPVVEYDVQDGRPRYRCDVEMDSDHDAPKSDSENDENEEPSKDNNDTTEAVTENEGEKGTKTQKESTGSTKRKQPSGGGSNKASPTSKKMRTIAPFHALPPGYIFPAPPNHPHAYAIYPTFIPGPPPPGYPTAYPTAPMPTHVVPSQPASGSGTKPTATPTPPPAYFAYVPVPYPYRPPPKHQQQQQTAQQSQSQSAASGKNASQPPRQPYLAPHPMYYTYPPPMPGTFYPQLPLNAQPQQAKKNANAPPPPPPPPPAAAEDANAHKSSS